MAGIVVGSVSVDVVPSAEQFAPRLQQQISGPASAVGDDIGRQIGGRVASKIADSIVKGLTDGAGRGTTPAAGAGDSAGGAFADAFKARLEAALQALPDVKITADSSDADRKLAELRAQLEELSSKQVGVDISDTEAKAKLDELKGSLDELGRKSESISIKVDTARASAELAAFRAELDAVTGGGGGGGSPAGGGGIFSAIASSAQSASSSITPMVAAIGLVGPALVPIGAAAAAGLGAIATMAGAATAGMGVLYLGLSDVVKAVTAVQTAQASAATDAASSAQAQLAAANQVKSAEASLANAQASAADAAEKSAQAVAASQVVLADAVRKASQDQITQQEQLKAAADAVTQARVNGAQQVETAEQSLGTAEQTLTNAVYTETQAQQALISARQTAQRQLESYAQQVADGALTQRQDMLNVETAKQSLDATLANPKASQLQREQAQLSYDQAVQAQKDQAQNYQNLLADAAAAQKAGVDGAAVVVNAQHQVLTAQQGVVSAQTGVAKAAEAVASAQTAAAKNVSAALQHQGDVERQVAQQQIADTEAVTKAQQGVTNAVEAQATQQRQSAFSIAQAQQSVTVALEAQHKAATSLSSSQQAVNAAMAKLTPAGQQLVTFITGPLMGAFSGLKGAAENGLLPGVQALLVDLLPMLPSLTSFVGGLAKTMGDLFSAAGKALTDPFWTKFFDWAAQTAGPTLQTMASTLGDFATGFAGMVQAMSPLTDMLGRAFAGMAKSFADFGTNTKPGSPLEQFVSYAAKSLPLIGATLESLGKAFGHIVEAAAPIGTVVLHVLSDFGKVIGEIPLPVIEGLLVGFAALILYANPIAALVIAVVELVTHWSEVWGEITKITSEAWDAVTGAFSDAWDWVSKFFEDHWKLILGIITGPIGLAVEQIATHWSDIEGAFSDAWDWVSKFFEDHWKLILGIITGPIGLAVEQIATHWSDITGAFSDAWTWVDKTWSKLWTGAEDLIGKPIDSAVSAIAGFFGAKGPLQSAFSAAWDWVSKTFGGLWGDAKNGVGAVITDPLQAVSAVVSGIWDDITKAFTTGVNDVIKLINVFIDGIDSIVGVIPGLPSKLIPDIPLLSTGPVTRSQAPGFMGPLPGHADGGLMSIGAGFATNGPQAIVGEGNPAWPEFVIPTDPAYRGRAIDLFTTLGSHLMAAGGIVPRLAGGGQSDGGGWSLNPITDLKKIGSGILSTVGDIASAALGPVKSAADAAIGLLPSSFVRTMAQGVVDYLFGGVGKIAAGSAAASTPGSGPSGPGAPAQVAAWIDQALGLMGMPATFEPGIASLIMHESGGNPNAINLWDSNAKAGHPSQGLMQTIPGTFHEYVLPALANMPITDPVANITAGVRYALANYGPGMLMAGGRHDPSGAYIGYDSGGWLQPGFTPVWNGTGQPEPVFNPQQWDAVKNGRGGGEFGPKLDRVISLLEANPDRTGELVAAGVAGEFERAAVAHAERSLMIARTR